MVNLVGGRLFSDQLVGGRHFLRDVLGGSSGRCSVQCFKMSRWSMDSEVKGDRWSVVSGWWVGGFVLRWVIRIENVHMRQMVILA